MDTPTPVTIADLTEAAMGLISNALDWKGDPPSQSPDSVEWRLAARRWLDTYAAHPVEDLAAADRCACNTAELRTHRRGAEGVCRAAVGADLDATSA